MTVLITTIVVLVVVALILTTSIIGEWIAAYKDNKSFKQQYKKYKECKKQMERARDRENNRF